MNEQREIIYEERYKVLKNENLRENIIAMAKDVISKTVDNATNGIEYAEEWDLAAMFEQLRAIIPIEPFNYTKEQQEELFTTLVQKALKGEQSEFRFIVC